MLRLFGCAKGDGLKISTVIALGRASDLLLNWGGTKHGYINLMINSGLEVNCIYLNHICAAEDLMFCVPYGRKKALNVMSTFHA